jgi:FkbM family methyltransferase
MTIVQLGACNGNDHVRQFHLAGNKLILVEANQMHMDALIAAYPNAREIFAAIVPDDTYGEAVTMYYSTLDAPNFEVTSIDREHVIKHGYPPDTIRSFTVATLTLTALLDDINEPIDILFIDIEGIDEDVIKATPLGNYDIDKVQIEMIHLKDRAGLIAYMDEQGYDLTNATFDNHGFDRIFNKRNKE